MKVIMYGAKICPDCVESLEILQSRSDIELDYRNIIENTSILKEFLNYRDHEEIFIKIKATNKIGIPFFLLEDGTKTLEITDFIDINDTRETRSNSCSVNGGGNC